MPGPDGSDGPVDRLIRSLRSLNRAYSPGHHGLWSARRRSGLVDQAVRALSEDLVPRVAVVAVGGYGRRLLLPGSDIDLMVLHGDRAPEAIRRAAERLFYPFWDAGLRLGHSVRTVQESLAASAERLDVACSLLDGRLVWGESSLFDELRGRLQGVLASDALGFLGRLVEDVERRRHGFPSCSVDLEPHLKEGPGGLRDVQAVRWALEVCGTEHIREEEAAALDRSEELLVRLRSALHLEVGPRMERLFFEHQPSIAAHVGFERSETLSQPDALMRSLFEHARQVEHVRDLVFARASATGTPARKPSPPSNPDELMDALARAGRAGSRATPAVLDAIGSATLGAPPYRWTERTRQAFLEVLRAGEAGASLLEATDRGGLLVGFIPEWGAVRCRPQRDPYHRLTVDLHLLHTATEAAALLRGDHEDPLVGAAAEAVDDPDAVLLGALLHDIGKRGEGRHVEVGARVAASALNRMGVSGPRIDDVRFLVEQHLLLSETAVRRDLSDQNLVLDVAARVGDPRRLAMLFVLTMADARATGPQASSPWRLSLVRELVAKVQHVLESGEMGRNRGAVLEERLRAIRSLLQAEPSRAVDSFLARLPRGYVMAVTPEAAAGHYRLVAPPIGTTEVRTEVSPGRQPASYRLTVVAGDRPGLLARIAGSLSLAGLSILSAEAFTTEDGVALDLFEVEPAYRGDVDEERWRQVRHTLRRALEGRLWLEQRMREKRRHYPPPRTDVEPQVRVLNDASDFSTVVEVEAADRIGLLYDLARAFEELSLDVHLAKVGTYGHRVVDAFYVRDLAGRKVEDAERARGIERAVLTRLADPG